MKALSLLIKPASGNCTMRCRYCFYADVAQRRDIPNRGMMTPETTETLIRSALSEAEELCVFGFQGGEPTLSGLEYFQTFVALVDKYNINKAEIRYSLQTNGLAIDAAWAAFLAQNRFLCGLSIDAEKQRHDAMRPDAAGKGTHKRGLDAARLLAGHGGEFNILTVVTRDIASHPDKTYRFYRDRGFRHIQFIPCIASPDASAKSAPYFLDAERYGKFLCRIFDLWYRDFVAGEYISVRMFDNYIHMLAGHPPESCAMAGRCQTHLLVEADGSVYPCDFYAIDKYRLGNIATDTIADMLAGETARQFVLPSSHVHASCQTCEYFPLCRGGCRRDRERILDSVPGLNSHCAAYRMFFAHALPRMRDAARKAFDSKH